MDWIHCNSCFIQPGCDKVFFLSNCGHIFCIDCKERCTNGLCRICERQCSYIPLSDQMRPDVAVYFSDPFDHVKREFRKMQQVNDFQKNHLKKLLEYQRKQVSKTKVIKELIEKMKQLEREKKKMKEENANLKKIITVVLKGSPLDTSSRLHRGRPGAPDNEFSLDILNAVLASGVSHGSDSQDANPLPTNLFTPPSEKLVKITPKTAVAYDMRNLNLSSAYSGSANSSRYNKPFLSSGVSSRGSVNMENTSLFTPPTATATSHPGYYQANVHYKPLYTPQNRMIVRPYQKST